MGAASVKVGRLRDLALALLLAWPATALADEPMSGRSIAEQFAEQARKVEAAHAAKLAEEERARAEQARITAEKLAADAKAKADAKTRALEQMKADEAEMLAQARAEAEERLAEMRRAEAEAAAKEAAILAEREREERARADEAARIAAEKAEAERIAKAEEIKAQEAKARAAEAARLAEERAAADKARLAREAEDRANAERALKEAADRKAERERQQAEAAQKALEAERQAEAEQLSEKLKRAREARSQQEKQEESQTAAPVPLPPSEEVATPQPEPAATPVIAVTPELKPSAAVADPALPPAIAPARVTVLLAMDAGNNGIRRFQKSADPILCVRESCYISTGPGTPATEMTRSRAFGTGNTLGQRAGACRNQLTCVFRDVDLGEKEALIQPIDMRIMRHDRREPLRATGDTSCAMVSGALHCATLLQSKDWRAWVVPEGVAHAAGADALQSALKAGLPVGRAANLGK